jgi:uncharacterized membrane protein
VAPKTTSANFRLAALVLAAITVAGGFLRLYQIDRNGFWLDEAFSVWMSAHPLPDLYYWLITIDQHPPLYYTLLHFWLWPGDEAAYVRGLSAFLSTLTIPAFFFIAARLGGVGAGLIAAAILALSPFHVRFAQEARMYALLMLMAVLATLALVYLLTDPRVAHNPIGAQIRSYGRSLRAAGWRGRLPWRTVTTDLAWLAYCIFTAATLLTHNTAVFFPLACNLFVLGFWLHRRLRGAPNIAAPGARALHPPLLRSWVLAQVGVLLLWLPWSYAFVVQSVGVYNEFWIPAPTPATVAGTLKTLVNDFLPQTIQVDGWVWLGYSALFALGMVGLRKRPALLMLLLCLLLTPLLGELLVSLRRPIFYDRTLIWATIPLYLFFTFGLLQLRWRALIAVVLIAVCTVNLLSLQNYFQNFTKEQWREAAAYMAHTVRDNDLLLFNATWVQIPFDYYFSRFDSSVVQHGVPVDLFDRGVLEPKMTAADLPRLRDLVEEHDRVWLVYSHDWYTDPQQLIPAALKEELHYVDTQWYNGLQILRFERR